MMTMDFAALLNEHRLNHFRDIAGANAAFTLPVSDRLVTRLVNEHLPPDGPVRELDLEAQPGNLVLARVKLTRPAFLPSVSLKLSIERQPVMPESPVLGLRMEMAAGLMGLAGPALKMMGSLPRGIHLDGDRLDVDFRAFLERASAMDVLNYVSDLQLSTDQGRFVIAGRISI
jgi:hypothetical protein